MKFKAICSTYLNDYTEDDKLDDDKQLYRTKY